MARRDRDGSEEPGESTSGPPGRFGEDLVGLDPDDPEARAFAAHLDRMEHPTSATTVEGILDGVNDFAEGANRARGHRRLVILTVVLLMLFGVCFTIWNALAFMIDTFAA